MSVLVSKANLLTSSTTEGIYISKANLLVSSILEGIFMSKANLLIGSDEAPVSDEEDGMLCIIW